ncbi:MAG TPA: hypothetical protein VD997_06330 [Phycisphaerales bacterium]|nr:hypothetical protein [Phycisphaerales bacterium]
MVSLTSGAVAQQEYASETRSWSFTAPEGWHLIPFDQVADMNAAAQGAVGSSGFKYVAGFSRSPSGIGTPYILVQLQDNHFKGMSYENIQRAANSELAREAEERVKRRMAGNFHFDPIRVEPSHARFVRTGTISTNGLSLECATYGYLGADKIVQFNCYSSAGQLGADQPKFDEMLATFRFAPDKQFTPGGGSEVDKAERLGYATGRIVAFALIGVVVAAIAGVIKKVRGG